MHTAWPIKSHLLELTKQIGKNNSSNFFLHLFFDCFIPFRVSQLLITGPYVNNCGINTLLKIVLQIIDSVRENI